MSDKKSMNKWYCYDNKYIVFCGVILINRNGTNLEDIQKWKAMNKLWGWE